MKTSATKKQDGSALDSKRALTIALRARRWRYDDRRGVKGVRLFPYLKSAVNSLQLDGFL
jgi:hypothetical protein